jgi:hypothetical protein
MSACIGHVDADLENMPQPPTCRAKMSRDFVSQEHAYHTKDPRGIEHRGLNARVQECDETWRWKTRVDREAHRTAKRDINLTQVPEVQQGWVTKRKLDEAERDLEA